MAITGLKGVHAAIFSESGGTVSYSNPFHVGDAMTANLSITMAKGSLYANNHRKEYKQKFDNGSLELGTDDLLDSVLGTLLGHSTKTLTIGQKSYTLNVSNGDDSAPDVGVGFYQTVVRGGVDKFRVIVLSRVQFAEPEDNAQTADNSITMNGKTITGTIMTDSNGDWKQDVTVDTEEEAEAIIEEILGTIS